MNKIISMFILKWLILEISADVYIKLAETDISGIEIGSTVYKNNSPGGCLVECNQQVNCNIVTHTLPDRCDLYYVLQENFCITTYDRIQGISETTAYIKTRKTINKACKTSKQCMNEFGLTCSNDKCSCEAHK